MFSDISLYKSAIVSSLGMLLEQMANQERKQLFSVFGEHALGSWGQTLESDRHWFRVQDFQGSGKCSSGTDPSPQK